MIIKVLLFAEAKDVAGKDSVQVPLPAGRSVSDLLDHLVQVVPDLLPIRSSLLVAVNNQFAQADQEISAEDTVACFPPVSGG